MSGASAEYREYVVAALLHDIGKLIRRAKLCSNEQAKSHVEHSVEFVDRIGEALKAAGLDVELVKRLVREHHEDGGIAPYDRAAAKERLPGDDISGQGLAVPGRREQEIPLLIYDADEKGLYVPPCPLPERLDEAEELRPARELDKVPPDKVCRCYRKSYEELLRMAGELNKLAMDYRQLVETLVHILKATASFVPAAVYGVEKPDTSLYAHSILAAALASTGGEFMLVSIDVGKIQEYITRARTTTWAMAILRGRSLRITLLQKIAARRLIDELNKMLGGDVVTHANILMDTGGEVVLLIPKVEGLDEVARRLEDDVLQESEGALSIYVAYSGPHRLDDIGKFEELMKELSRKVLERKLTYKLYPKPSEKGNAKSRFGTYSFYNDVCQFCGRPARTTAINRFGETLELCDMCKDELFAGLAARNLQAVIIGRGLSVEHEKMGRCELAHMSMLGYTAVVAGGECDVDALAAVAAGGSLYTVNTRRFVRKRNKVAYGFVYTNQYLPTAETGGVASLEGLGDRAVFAKLDANSMGLRKFKSSRRPSLFVTFSTAVSTAYELYPALLAGKGAYSQSLYVIFSGGDDAMVVGDPAALEYVSEVARYAESWGFRTAIGVKIESYDYPIYYAFTDAEERLEKAKELNRGESLAVLAENPLVYADAGTLAEIYRGARGLVEGLAEEERIRNVDRVTRLLYSRLLDLYRAVELCASKRELDGRRTAAKALVELAYIINRRGEELGEKLKELENITGLPMDPQKFAEFYAPLLQCRETQQLRRALGRGIAAINIIHLMLKGRR
ncbi:MAG: type III-A CRISPR-associated protein Cas10/Csm1 [Thermoproteus sp.]